MENKLKEGIYTQRGRTNLVKLFYSLCQLGAGLFRKRQDPEQFMLEKELKAQAHTIQLLWQHYNIHLQIIQRDFVNDRCSDRLFAYLKENGMHTGVCYCALQIYKISIYDDQWVQKHFPRTDALYWFETPDPTYTVDRNINLLACRLDILRVEIQNTFQYL